MRFDVIAVGRQPRGWLSDGCAEYQKRLSAYAQVRVCELPDSALGGESDAEVAAALQKEAAAIERAVPERAVTVALCVEGEQLDSLQLAEFLRRHQNGGDSRFAFVIGSSHGLDDSVKKRAALRLSLSRLTFAHALARVVLLEQLYRACSIIAGGKYHK